MNSSNSFRKSTWDPWLIITQIITLQSTIYLSQSTLILLTLSQQESKLIDFLFDCNKYTFEYISGWISIFNYFLTSLIGALLIVVIVKRAKLCLDFACTSFFFHLVICYQYNGIGIVWLFCSVVNLVCMALLSEYLCMRLELRPVVFGSIIRANATEGIELQNRNIGNEEETVGL